MSSTILDTELSCAFAAHINLERSARGTGFISNPAVIDNSMQMGPAIGAIFGAKDNATRVVGGLEAYQAYKFPDKGIAFAASEMQPQTVTGDIYTSHWLIGDQNQQSLAIKDLKVTSLDIWNRRMQLFSTVFSILMLSALKASTFLFSCW